jgi:hypothetical protein
MEWEHWRLQKLSQKENGVNRSGIEDMKEKFGAGIEVIHILEEFPMGVHIEICSLMTVIVASAK